MREWEQVHRDLNATIRYPKIVRFYADIARERTELAPFDTPVALVAFLERLHRDPTGNLIYLSIVEIWRRGSLCYADVAGRILWLGLWPLLNGLCWRQAP